MARPVIVDCEGLTLTHEEKALFKEFDPYGFILFARNCQSPDQLKKLTSEMRETVGREDAPIFIDQEGGRVCRLNKEYWRKPPSADTLLRAYERDNETGLDAVKLNARLIAEDLREMGITVDCYPLLDLRFVTTNNVIGDRSFGDDIETVALLGAAACEGLFSGGVLPVIKHIPGHGRALVDSHLELPVVEASFETLLDTDFVPFKALNHMPLAMTAHITYSSIDPLNPVTLSEASIRRIIREQIGFKGVLISDDIGMKALTGKPADIAKQALRAGCDLVLQCNAPLTERREVLEALYDFNLVNESWIHDMFRPRQNIPSIDKDEIVAWLYEVLTS